ncbi:MAG: hypothetical protein OEV86_12980 [Candidatus Krumholzibacteria bacterium]|nr:hypothetical protein [Candidatus Krumholzibacteria bacterium]
MAVERRRGTRNGQAYDIWYDTDTNTWVEYGAGPDELDPNASIGLKSTARDTRFNRDLARYDAEAQKYRQALLGAFGIQSQTAQGLAQRGTQATVSQFLQRRGIDSTRGGLGASLQNSTQAQLQGQTMQAQQNFSTTLYGLMQQQRDAFINKEFDFFRRIDLMGYEAELQKDIMRFQQQLQSDLSFRDAFMGILGTAGTVAAALIPGAGPAVAAGVAASQATNSRNFENQYRYE